jgi:hypothetical protein
MGREHENADSRLALSTIRGFKYLELGCGTANPLFAVDVKYFKPFMVYAWSMHDLEANSVSPGLSLKDGINRGLRRTSRSDVAQHFDRPLILKVTLLRVSIGHAE